MRFLQVVGFVVGTAVGLAGCSGGSGTTSPSTTPAPGGTPSGTNAVVITITSNNGAQSFSPNPASIQAGQQIVFRNSDSVAHQIVVDNTSIDTGTLGAGQSSAAAAWNGSGGQYHCTIHPGMVGSFNEPTAPPPSEDPYY
jgi:plastocyanin